MISKYHFMAFKEILEFRVQIIRKYIMVVNVPLHCSVASPPFPYNKPGSLTNYMRRWWPKTFYSPSLISSVTQSYTNPVKWQTSACKRVAAAAPLPSTMYACLPACQSPCLPLHSYSASATACLLALLPLSFLLTCFVCNCTFWGHSNSMQWWWWWERNHA